MLLKGNNGLLPHVGHECDDNDTSQNDIGDNRKNGGEARVLDRLVFACCQSRFCVAVYEFLQCLLECSILCLLLAVIAAGAIAPARTM